MEVKTKTVLCFDKQNNEFFLELRKFGVIRFVHLIEAKTETQARKQAKNMGYEIEARKMNRTISVDEWVEQELAKELGLSPSLVIEFAKSQGTELRAEDEWRSMYCDFCAE